MHGREENSVQDFGGKAGGKETLGRPRRRWEDGIRMNLKETGWRYRMDPVSSVQGLVEDPCDYGDEPSVSGATLVNNVTDMSLLNNATKVSKLVLSIILITRNM
jgi:hypothetical protein